MCLPKTRVIIRVSNPVLFVIGVRAEGTTRLTDLETLRFKETNRVTVMVETFRKMGVKIEYYETTFTIQCGFPCLRLRRGQPCRSSSSPAVGRSRVVLERGDRNRRRRVCRFLFPELLQTYGLGRRRLRDQLVQKGSLFLRRAFSARTLMINNINKSYGIILQN